MNKTEIFQVLGINETKDEALIKKAYREKLTITNPEDNPEGFKRLRTAYESACVFARTPEEEKVEEEDNTPSGLWVKRVADIYANINLRRDIECWEELFQDDIFLSLEEEENCINKLLGFLMEHFKLPTNIWKLLDEKLFIVRDCAKLREHFPADFVNYLLVCCKQGEDIEFEYFEGEPNADYDLFLQYSDKCWDSICKDQLEQAQEYLNNADDLEIYHPVIEVSRAWLWEKQGRVEEAVRWMKDLVKRYERNLMVNYHTAEMLWRNGYKEESAAIYERIKADNEKHYMANKCLMNWYYTNGRFKEAKKCAEEVIGMGGAEDIRDTLEKINFELEKELEKKHKENPDCAGELELGWCYLQDGRFAAGIQLALKMEQLITLDKEAEYKGLLTKLYVESGEYEKAVKVAEVWEKALKEKLATEQGEKEEKERKKDEDRVYQSYAIRAHCYYKLGYKDEKNFHKAMEMIEKAELLSCERKNKIYLLLEKAHIYVEMEEYEKALDVVTKLVDEYQIYAAYATAQKAYSKLWDARGVLKSGYECIRVYPEYEQAYERIAKVYLDLDYMDDFHKILEDAKAAGIQSVFLEAYQYQLEHEVPDNDEMNRRLKLFRETYMKKLEEGYMENYEKGLPQLNECLYLRPCAYMLVERALFHREGEKYDLAEADFERAIAEEPDNPYAYSGLAYLYKLQGEYEKAIVCMKKAMLYFEEEYTRSYSELGDLYTLLGLDEMALQAYKQIFRVGGEAIWESKYYMRRYAYSLLRNQRMEEAVAAISRAYTNPLERYEELVSLYYKVEDEKNAREVLTKWKNELPTKAEKEKKAEYGKYLDAIAWTELVFGNVEKAVEYFEKEWKLKDETGNDLAVNCDIIFACILNGNDKKAKDYIQKLMKAMNEKKKQGINDCHEREKMALVREFVIHYYDATKEELEEILAKEENANICYFCTQCRCKEMEGMRVLHMLRVGKIQEAFEYMDDLLEKNPLDDWIRSIRNVCKKGIKVVPYSVNGHTVSQLKKEKGNQKEDGIHTSANKKVTKERIKCEVKGVTETAKYVFSSLFKKKGF